MNKFDAKYQLYNEKMIDAMIQLLQKKSFDAITVTEICRTAGIQRSTFYAHYSDPYELLQDMANQALKSFWAYWEAHVPQNHEPKINKENVKVFFSYVQEHQEQVRVLFTEPPTVFWEPILNWLMECMKPITKGPEHIRYTAIFYLSGVVNVASRWLYTGCQESVDSLCDLIFSCLPNQ